VIIKLVEEVIHHHMMKIEGINTNTSNTSSKRNNIKNPSSQKKSIDEKKPREKNSIKRN